MTIEYRDDDITDEGWCPECGRYLKGVLLNGKAFCEIHGWVYVNWNPPREPPDEDE